MDQDTIDIGRDPSGITPVAYTFRYFKAARLQKCSGQDEKQKCMAGLTKAKTVTLDGKSPSSAMMKVKIAEQERILRRELAEKQHEAEEKLAKMSELLKQKENELKQNQV